MAILKVQGKSRSQIERISQRDLEYFDPECLHVPKSLCVWEAFNKLEDLGVETGIKENLAAEGMCYCDDGAITILIDCETYDGAVDGDPRSRFTLMHEIFHALHHPDYLIEATFTSTVMYRRSELRAFEDPEWQANTYASAILMPAEMAVQVVRQSSPSTVIDNLMETFTVSRSAAEKRLENLGKMNLL